MKTLYDFEAGDCVSIGNNIYRIKHSSTYHSLGSYFHCINLDTSERSKIAGSIKCEKAEHPLSDVEISHVLHHRATGFDGDYQDKMTVTIKRLEREESFEYSSGIMNRVPVKNSSTNFKNILNKGRRMSHMEQLYLERMDFYVDMKSVVWCLLLDYQTVVNAGVQDLGEHLEEEGLTEGLKYGEIKKLVTDLRSNAQKFERLFGGKIQELEEFYIDY